jgi:hypothetical protein
VRSLQERWAQVEPPSPGAPPAIIDRGPLGQQYASVGEVPPCTNDVTRSGSLMTGHNNPRTRSDTLCECGVERLL